MTDAEQDYEDNPDVALLVLQGIVCCSGLIGNTIVIFVIVVLKEFKKAITNWYVLQLAIADCCFLLTLPFKIAEDVNNEWIYSGSMCKVKETMLFVNYYSSILFLLVMSFDRYIAVCRGLGSKLQKLRKKSSSRVITAIVWVVSLLLSIPIMIYSDKSGIEPNCKCNYDFKTLEPVEKCKDSQLRTDCELIYEDMCVQPTGEEFEYLYDNDIYFYEDEYEEYGSGSDEGYYEQGCSYAAISRGWTAYVLFNFIAMFVVPFMLMSVFYSSIALRLRGAKRRRKSITSEVSTTSNSGIKMSVQKRSMSIASQKESKKRSRVTLVCFVLVTLFLTCWLPFHAVHLAKIKGILASSSTCAKLASATTTIAYLNSALNPFLYNFMGTKIRERFRSAAGTITGSMKRRASFSVQYSRGSNRARVRSSTDTSHSGTTVAMRTTGGESKVEPAQSVAE